MGCNKRNIIHLVSIDSTNRYVRDEANLLWEKSNGMDYVVVAAEHQTAGRGQRGNCWNSNAGENLLFSILLRPGKKLEVCNQFLLSQTVAVALHESMRCFGIDSRLKWPNDIYVGNRKLAGVLVELDYSGVFVEQAIIGIGINVNQELFPDMDRIPVSMKMLQGRDFVVENVLSTILEQFERYYAELCCGNSGFLSSEYIRLLLGVNEKRTFIDATGTFSGVIEGVERDGHLLVRHDSGELLCYSFKEIEQLL